MSDRNERPLPRWPLRIDLSLLIVIEVFSVLMLIIERKTGNIPMIVNSVGILVFCVLAWRGINWSRWVLIVFLVWKITTLGIALGPMFKTGDHRIGGTIMILAFYVLAWLLIASPLGRSGMRKSN